MTKKMCKQALTIEEKEEEEERVSLLTECIVNIMGSTGIEKKKKKAARNSNKNRMELFFHQDSNLVNLYVLNDSRENRTSI